MKEEGLESIRSVGSTSLTGTGSNGLSVRVHSFNGLHENAISSRMLSSMHASVSVTLVSPSGKVVWTHVGPLGALKHQTREVGVYTMRLENVENVAVKVRVEMETVGGGEKVWAGTVVADTSVIKDGEKDKGKERGGMQTIDTFGLTHFGYLRFDLSIVDEVNLKLATVLGQQLKAILHLFVEWTDEPIENGTCRLRHHYYDPIEHAHAPDSEIKKEFLHVERPDYREWKWSEDELTFENRPRDPIQIGGVPCRSNQSIEFDVSSLIATVFQGKPSQRQVTFELRSDDHWVKYMSRNSVFGYKKPYLSIDCVFLLPVLMHYRSQIKFVRSNCRIIRRSFRISCRPPALQASRTRAP